MNKPADKAAEYLQKAADADAQAAKAVEQSSRESWASISRAYRQLAINAAKKLS